MIVGKIIAGHPLNSFVRQIKNDATVKIFKVFQEKANSIIKLRIGAVDQLHYRKLLRLKK